jgi:hypothetical protein
VDGSECGRARGYGGGVHAVRALERDKHGNSGGVSGPGDGRGGIGNSVGLPTLKHLLIASVFGLVAASPPPAAASWQSVPQVVVYNQSCDIAIENGVPFTDWIGVRSCSAAKLGKPAINACHSTAGVDDGCSDLISDPLTGYLIAAVVDGTHTCPGAGCNVKIAYNQGSRSGSNWTQATVANRPLLITNCINTSFPCMQGPTGQTTSVLVGASFTSSVVTTIMQVFQRPTCGATGAWFSMVESGNGAGSGNRMTVQTSGGATGCGYQLAGASGCEWCIICAFHRRSRYDGHRNGGLASLHVTCV